MVASISGLTGALYIWQPEFSAALNPKLLAVSEFDSISENTIHLAAHNLAESYGDSISVLNLPYRGQQTISVVFDSGETHFYHPVTGRLLGEKSTSITFFEGLLNIHRTLGIPGFGKYIVGGSTVLFFLLLLTSGFYIWWNRYKSQLRKGLTLKPNADRRRRNYDLHKVLGVLFFMPLMVIAVTGTFFTYMPYSKSMLSLINSSTKKEILANSSTIGEKLTVKDLLQKPSKDGYKLRSVYFPKKSGDGHQFRYIRNRFISIGFRRTKELKTDKNDQIVSVTDYDTDLLNDKIAQQMYPVHIGEIAGIIGRILVFITGFVPITLLITSFRFYRFRK